MIPSIVTIIIITFTIVVIIIIIIIIIIITIIIISALTDWYFNEVTKSKNNSISRCVSANED